MRKERLPAIAFMASGLMVIASVPLTAVWPQPNLPGFAVVLTGALAWGMSRRFSRGRVPRAPAALVAPSAALMAFHLLAHQMRMAHDWLDPIYAVAIVAYVIVAIGQAFRPSPPEAA